MSTQSNDTEFSKKGEPEKMVLKNLYVNPSMWEQAKTKAQRNRLSLAFVVRQLLTGWLKGDIEIKIYDEEN